MEDARCAPSTITAVVIGLMVLGAVPALSAASAQESAPPDPFRTLRTLIRYEVADSDTMRVVTETIVDEDGATTYEHKLLPGSLRGRFRAVDLASAQDLEVEIGEGVATVQLERPLAPRAEQRLRIVEQVRPGAFTQEGDGLFFRQQVPPGRVVVVFPAGVSPESSSVPAQWQLDDGRLKAGIINSGEGPVSVTIRATPSPLLSPERLVEGDFRAEDERNIVYWVEDASEGRFRLSLELVIDHPGQRHAYSVLNKTDHITEPATLDVDRGIDLPTRIVDGATANQHGDSPVPFAPDDSVFVADLGYEIPEGGSARVRLFQSAKDPEGLRVLPDGHLRWDRFLARLRTRIVLPRRWHLTSADHPPYIHRDAEGRLVFDWVHTGGDRPPLVITARPADANEPR